MTKVQKGNTHPSIIHECLNPACINDGQDTLYGKHMRIMNEKQNKVKAYKCVVCGTVFTPGAAKI